MVQIALSIKFEARGHGAEQAVLEAGDVHQHDVQMQDEEDYEGP